MNVELFIKLREIKFANFYKIPCKILDVTIHRCSSWGLFYCDTGTYQLRRSKMIVIVDLMSRCICKTVVTVVVEAICSSNVSPARYRTTTPCRAQAIKAHDPSARQTSKIMCTVEAPGRKRILCDREQQHKKLNTD